MKRKITLEIRGGGMPLLSAEKGGKALISLSPVTSVKGGLRRKGGDSSWV